MSKTEPTYDCFHDKPAVEPNGDISGPGVLAGFLGTTYLAILVLVGYYLFAFDPTKNPYAQPKGETPGPTTNGTGDSPVEMDILPNSQPEASAPRETNTLAPQEHGASQVDDDTQTVISPQPGSHEDDWAPNPVDVMFLAGVRGFLHIRQFEHDESADQAEIERIFNNCVRSLCDAQLMTGVGILLSAYCTLYAPDGGGGIMAYHWQIAVYLAWMSNLTYFTGMTFLRKYLNQKQNTVERWWRAIAMTILFLLVFVSLQPLVYFNWNIPDPESAPQPATASSFAFCFFRLSDIKARMADQKDGFKMPFRSASSTILSMCLLIFSFASRIVKLTSLCARFFRVKVRRRISDFFKSFAERYGALDLVVPALLTGRLYADFYTSMLSEIYWAIVAALWATIRVFESRRSADVHEDEFTFGQILAMFLLALPIITISVALWPLRSKLLPSMESQKPRLEDPPSPSYLHSRRRHSVLPETFHEPLSDEEMIYYAMMDGTRSYGLPMSGLMVTYVCLEALVITAVYFWLVIAQKFNGYSAAWILSMALLPQPAICFWAFMAIAESAFEHPNIFMSEIRGTEDPLDATNMAIPALSDAEATLFLLRIDCIILIAIRVTSTMMGFAWQPLRERFGVLKALFIVLTPLLIVALDYVVGLYSKRLLYEWYGSLRSRYA